MSANNGGQAFPIYDHHGDGQQFLAETGMTLRDYFAASAIQAAVVKAIHNFRCDGIGDSTVDWGNIAESAYDAADAMLKAREA